MTRKGICAMRKKEVKTIVQASQRDCVDFELPGSSDLIAATITPDSEPDRPRKRPRSDPRPRVAEKYNRDLIKVSPIGEHPEAIKLFDLDSKRQTETEVSYSELAWTDVIPGHTYRACITAETSKEAHISAMSICRTDEPGQTTC